MAPVGLGLGTEIVWLLGEGLGELGLTLGLGLTGLGLKLALTRQSTCSVKPFPQAIHLQAEKWPPPFCRC